MPIAIEEDEEKIEGDIPVHSLPPFEPLILWKHPEDEALKIEVTFPHKET